jgi:hypothetical protein
VGWGWVGEGGDGGVAVVVDLFCDIVVAWGLSDKMPFSVILLKERVDELTWTFNWVWGSSWGRHNE